jgi:hypothetical protein
MNEKASKSISKLDDADINSVIHILPSSFTDFLDSLTPEEFNKNPKEYFDTSNIDLLTTTLKKVDEINIDV